MINAQRLHRQYPETFYVPSYEELEKLKPNDKLKYVWVTLVFGLL